MTREEAKQLLPILQAFAEGKTIQYRCDGKYSDIKIILLGELEINSARYRIKPSSTYRPFKDAEECWQEMQKHQPFGWVKTGQGYYNTKSLELDKGAYSDYFDVVFKEYVFPDGAPFGIQVEEVND